MQENGQIFSFIDENLSKNSPPKWTRMDNLTVTVTTGYGFGNPNAKRAVLGSNYYETTK